MLTLADRKSLVTSLNGVRIAERMATCSLLRVRLYLDIHRGHLESSSNAEIVARFVQKFVTQDWPAGFPLPEVYYDPRSLAPDPVKRSRLGA